MQKGGEMKTVIAMGNEREVLRAQAEERKLREKLERLSQSKFPVIQKHAGKCLQLLDRVQDERR